jgi:type IV pilus assembly protein PilZ
MAMPARGGITTINYDTVEKLYASYLPFMQNGAIFVPSNQQQMLGAQVFVAITLPHSSERLPVNGKVVWVNHRTQGNRPAGFALQLAKDETGLRLKNEIERLLVGHINSDRPTYTL